MEFKEVKTILIRILFLNWLVAIAKILIGFSTGALSILIDGFHSLFDGMSNVMGLVGIRIAEQPRDRAHPYGHRKFEALAALGIAFLILITGYEFLKNTIERFVHPFSPDLPFFSFLVMGGALLVDFFVYRYENRRGKELKSTILIADSLHTKSHFFTTPAVILGMVAIKIGFPIFDPIIASLVIIMLGKLAWEITQHTTNILCDRAFVDKEKIEKIASAINGVKSAHQIRTRGDEHYVFLDMHITLDPELSLEEAHDISHELKEKIINNIPQIKDVVIHIEPAEKGVQK